MQAREAALAVMLTFCAPTALANNSAGAQARQPRAITAVSLGEREIEFVAVGQHARADTAVRRAYLEECQEMGKILPGYPQPAFMSLDIRVKF